MLDEKAQLPQWQSHKRYRGDKIVRVTELGPCDELANAKDSRTRWHLSCGVVIVVSDELKVRGAGGPEGGYYVLYEDGYESWSPAKAFEEGNTRIAGADTALAPRPLPGSPADIENRFTYHSPKEGQPEKYEALRGSAKLMGFQIIHNCPESRERALALTHLEESVMWGNAAIARNG